MTSRDNTIKIRLVNFRKFKDFTITIGTSIVKIDGESGSGKSTILDSIYWCLYGKLNKVKPRDGSGPTEVTMEIPYRDTYITIRRRNRSDLSIWIDEESYEGDHAQSIIDQCFGTWESFNITSYLRAESMHKFISATPSEKKEMTSLLFPDINLYDKYLSRLKDKKKEEEKRLELLSTKRISLSSSLDALKKNHTWLEEYMIEDTDDIYKVLLVYNMDKIPTHQDIQRLTNQCSSILGRYETLIDECVEPTPIDRDSIHERISSIRDRLSTPTSYMDIQKRIGICTSLLSKYNMLIDNDIPPTLIDTEHILSSIEEKERDLQDRLYHISTTWSNHTNQPLSIPNIQRLIRESYSILGRYDGLKSQKVDEPRPIDTNEIMTRIQDIRSEILSSKVSSESRESKLAYLDGSLQSLLLTYDEECLSDIDIVKRLHSLCSSYEDSVRKLSDLEKKVRETEQLLLEYENSLRAILYNEKLKDILECPKCHIYLRHTDTLCEVDEDIEPKVVQHHISKEEVDNLRLSLSTYTRTYKDLLSRIEEYDRVLSNNTRIGEVLRTHGGTQAYSKYIVEMRGKKERIDSLTSEIDKVKSDTTRYLSPTDMEVLERELRDLEMTLSKYNLSLSKYRDITSQMEKIEREHPWVLDGSTHINILEGLLSSYQSVESEKVSISKERESIDSQINQYKLLLSKYESTHRQVLTMLEENHWLVDGQSHISHLESQLEEAMQIQTDHDTMKRELATLESHLSNYEMTMSKYESTRCKVSDLLSQHPWLEKGREYIDGLQSLSLKIIDYNRKVEMKRVYTSYSDYKDKLSQLESTIKSHQSRLDNMCRLEALLNEAYRRYVDSKMGEIEYDIAMLGKLFFNESMNISIISDRNDKASFDIQVEYEGTVYDDIRTMSTGERKRLSIILHMVLCKHLDAKILMLDEAFSPIGMEQRGIVLNELSKMNIPIIFTSHDAISGGYAEELRLD